VHWSSYPTTVALIVHWLFDIPFSFTAHAYDIYVVPRLLSVKINEAEFAVTCAKVNAEYLRRAAGTGSTARVIVNYHGVDLDRFPPRAAEPSGDVPYLVSCGSLQIYKGHHLLIQACSKLERPFRLVIIGDGLQRANLEALARQLGIADRVTLTGPLSQADVAQWYAKAHVFVLASIAFDRTGKRDVIPNVLAEAMAMKVPVVATRISGIHELVEDGISGRLVTSGDPDALAAVLEELLANPAERQRLAEGGYRRVREIFDRKINIQELAALFAPDAVQPPTGTRDF
jgi:glycosyltransferase involved in cell wall biosynthesis